MGHPTDDQRDAFTRVLKGQISVGSALYPQGVKVRSADFARSIVSCGVWDKIKEYLSLSSMDVVKGD
jgi:hypothetical protein